MSRKYEYMKKEELIALAKRSDEIIDFLAGRIEALGGQINNVKYTINTSSESERNQLTGNILGILNKTP